MTFDPTPVKGQAPHLFLVFQGRMLKAQSRPVLFLELLWVLTLEPWGPRAVCASAGLPNLFL